MKWIKENYRILLLWLVLLAIAPLFVEILFIANIMGAEAAFGFLLLVIKDVYENWQYRVQRIKEFLTTVVQIIQNHPVCQANIYLFHVTLSIAVLFFSGSMIYSTLIWYPIALSGSTVS
ncbi:MAG: hypothetical protein ACRBHB_15915 [Arenicella sp.]